MDDVEDHVYSMIPPHIDGVHQEIQDGQVVHDGIARVVNQKVVRSGVVVGVSMIVGIQPLGICHLGQSLVIGKDPIV